MEFTFLYQFADLQNEVDFIRERHGDQKRNNGGDYYLHLMAVTELLYLAGERDRPTLVASLFHDLLEDTKTTYQEIKDLYGYYIADMVLALTKPPKEPTVVLDDKAKRVKTMAYYKTLRTAPPGSVRIKVYDRIHNLSEMKGTSIGFQIKYILDSLDLLEALQPVASTDDMAKLNDAFYQAVRFYIESTRRL